MRGVGNFFERHRSGALFLVLVTVSLFMMLFSSSTVILRPKEVGHSLFSLVQEGISGVGSFFSRTVNSVGELRRLSEEHDLAIRKLREYEGITRNYDALKEENSRLRQLLGFSQNNQFRHIPSQVIAKDPENFFSTITINKGSLDGIGKDMAVVAFQNGLQGLVGKVIETGLSTATVMPIYDRSCYVAARLFDSRYEGLLNGRGTPDDPVIMRYVKKFAKNDIHYDDLVITSGMRSLYPKGIYVGRVRTIVAKEYETSLELSIEPVIDFSRLENVFVLVTEE